MKGVAHTQSGPDFHHGLLVTTTPAENGLLQASRHPTTWFPEEVPREKEKLLSFKVVKSKRSPDFIAAVVTGLWGTLSKVKSAETKVASAAAARTRSDSLYSCAR